MPTYTPTATRTPTQTWTPSPSPTATVTPTSVPSGTVITKYYYFGSQRVAMKAGDTTYYFHADHLGSTSVTTDASGAVVNAQTYLAFGAVRTSEGGPALTDFSFTGQRLDSASGLLYYGARYYDSALGRFIQPDTIVPNPFNPQSLNRYSYGLNNPVKYIDPTGHLPQYTCPDGICDPGPSIHDGVRIPDESATRCTEAISCGLPPDPTPPELPATSCSAPDADPQSCSGGPAGKEKPEHNQNTQMPNGNSESSPTASPTQTSGRRVHFVDPLYRTLFNYPGQTLSAHSLGLADYYYHSRGSWMPGPWTIAAGVGGFAEAGGGVQGDLGLFALDSTGDLQIFYASGGGRLSTGLGAGGGGYVLLTNGNVSQLGGLSSNTGFTATAGGVDYIVGKDHAYDGIQFGFGPQPSFTGPIPADFHSGLSGTWLSPLRIHLW